MTRRKIMVIGPTGCGKTSLIRAIDRSEKPLKRTQDIIFGKETMDVPGAYLENPWMYKHLISAAQNHASHVLILVDQSDPRETYPHGFAKVFTCPVTGVIIKSDKNPENLETCRRQLAAIGVSEPYFSVNIHEQETVQKLREYLLEDAAMRRER